MYPFCYQQEILNTRNYSLLNEPSTFPSPYIEREAPSLPVGNLMARYDMGAQALALFLLFVTLTQRDG